MKKYTQQYLITCDVFNPFFSKRYEFENHFRAYLNMIVYDIWNHTYTTNGFEFKDTESDHS